MRKSMAIRAAAVVLTGGLLAGGCVEIADLISSGNPLAAFITVMSYFKAKAGKSETKAAKKLAPIKGNLDVPLTGSIGGLSGTFTIGFDKFGQFSGTGKIGKDHKSAVVKAVDTPELLALVHGLVLESTQVDLTVTTASVKVTGRQTTGGVKKTWNGTIKFKGTVVSGGEIGRTVKGTLKSHGKL